MMKRIPSLALLSLALGLTACQSTSPKASPAPAQAPPPAATSPVATAAPEPKPPASQSVAELRTSLHDPDMYVRMNAAEELGNRNTSSPEVFAALLAAVD